MPENKIVHFPALLQKSPVSLKIPSDLFGVTTARYEWSHGSEPKTLGDYAAALGAACDQIRWSIRALGSRKMNKLAAELETVKDRQEKQEDILKQLVAFSMSGFIYDHLKNIYFAQRGGKTSCLSTYRSDDKARPPISDGQRIHQACETG
jgi:hypothetical protein